MASAMQRDMSEDEFLEALERHGMRVEGYRGHVNLGVPDRRIRANPLEAGVNKRSQLAYLLTSRERVLAEPEAKVEAKTEADLDPDSELMYRSLPRGEDR